MSQRYIILLSGLFLLLSQPLFSQIGLSVSPPRLYYQLKAGEAGTQKVLISNVSKDHSMSLSLTIGDWKYDEQGNNLMLPPDSLATSCATWLSVPEGTYITLEPGEQREINLNMTVPHESDKKGNVQTAMLYVTQMNAVDGTDSDGAAIKVNVRQGIKIYRSGCDSEVKKLEIEHLKIDREVNSLALVFKNLGNIWINGKVTTSLFNQTTGDEFALEETIFYTLPDDHRTMYIPIGKPLEKGDYVATVVMDYGEDTTLEAAELQFSHE